MWQACRAIVLTSEREATMSFSPYALTLCLSPRLCRLGMQLASPTAATSYLAVQAEPNYTVIYAEPKPAASTSTLLRSPCLPSSNKHLHSPCIPCMPDVPLRPFNLLHHCCANCQLELSLHLCCAIYQLLLNSHLSSSTPCYVGSVNPQTLHNTITPFPMHPGFCRARRMHVNLCCTPAYL